jgi:hypothetical protein
VFSVFGKGVAMAEPALTVEDMFGIDRRMEEEESVLIIRGRRSMEIKCRHMEWKRTTLGMLRR